MLIAVTGDGRTRYIDVPTTNERRAQLVAFEYVYKEGYEREGKSCSSLARKVTVETISEDVMDFICK